jgi:hypothetical protein
MVESAALLVDERAASASVSIREQTGQPMKNFPD